MADFDKKNPKAMKTKDDPKQIREAILRDGYVAFSGVLAADEIKSIRRAVVSFFKTGGRLYDYGLTQPDAFSSVPAIRWLITHPGILEAVRKCAGRDDIQFTFHSDCHMNMLSGWHTDTGAYFTTEEVAPAEFQVYKVGIYLQDHFENSQGLTVSEGSHLPPNRLNPARVKPLKTRAGDIIVFDTRIWHVGDQKRLHEKIFGKIVRNEKIKYEAGFAFRKLMGRQEKISVFFTYGAPNVHTLEFSKRNMVRQNRQCGIQHSTPPPDLISLLESGHVDMAPLESVPGHGRTK